MVKVSKKLLIAAVLVTVLNFQSCGKYEDGPSFSLKTKKGRLVGEWEVVKMYDNQGVQVYPYSSTDYSVELEFEFEKDGDFALKYKYSYYGFTYNYSYKGEWEFSSDKEELEVEIQNEVQDWEIKRLTSKELWFEDADGNEWELEAI